MEETLQNNKSLWELFETITQLDGREECGQFFRDLCTLTELELMAERWLVARMITQHISYRRISELTGTSTATVTRIAHWLHYGEGGYRVMLERVSEKSVVRRSKGHEIKR